MDFKLIIKEELKKQNIRNKQITECSQILENLVNNLLLINEVEWVKDNPSPTYEWNLEPKIENQLDQSLIWVKTKDDVIKYLNILLEKIKKLPKPLKTKIIKYVLASFLGILTLTQVKSIEKQIQSEPIRVTLSSDISTPIKKQEKIRKPSQELYSHLKNEEGIGGKPVLYFYDLGDGAYTTGYGHAVFSNPRRGSTGGDYNFVPKYEDIKPYSKRNKKITTITKEQAEQLLYDDMLKASEGVNKILDGWEKKGIKPEITQGMYDAMVSIAYNHGVGNLRMSDFIQLVKRGEFEKAKEEIKKISSNLFDQYPGLKIRREKESRMFMS